MTVVEPAYAELASTLQTFVQPWRRLTIGIDGRDGAGKSTLARYLAWQLGMPAIEMDLFIIRDTSPLQHRIEELRRVVEARHSLGRPVIVEGILLLATLEKIQVRPDYLIFVEDSAYEGTSELGSEIDAYVAEYRPEQRCNFLLQRNSDDGPTEVT